jgi:hypothetical protein
MKNFGPYVEVELSLEAFLSRKMTEPGCNMDSKEKARVDPGLGLN